ncbi:MAG: DUF3343 domain-containing protein [Lachnospiraceae bacterium]|nr:DUF3343 domain-containing protein [Candidatus Equihabitans merdae]
MAADARLRREEIKAVFMPTPQSVIASCGLSLRFSPDVTQDVEDYLDNEIGRDMYSLYEAVRQEGKMQYRSLRESDE